MSDTWIPTYLPDSWSTVELKEICDVVRGGSPRPMGDPRYFNGNIPFIKIGDVTKISGDTVYDSETKVNELGAAKSRYLEKGTLILSNSGTVCVPVFLGTDACIHDGFVTFLDMPNCVDQHYFYHFFKYIRPYIIEKHKQGVTQVNLNTQIVGEINFLFPPINEQKRIVAKIEALFAELEAGVASLELAQAQLQTYRQALLKHAFEGKLTAQWRTANADKLEDASTLLQRIQAERQARHQAELAVWKEEVKTWEANGKPGKKPTKPSPPKDLPPLTPAELADLPQLPAGWAWERVGQITEVSGGLTKNQKRQALPERRPYLRVANVYANQLDLEEVHKIGIAEAEIDRVLLQKGDLLIVEGNGSIDQIGRVAVWDGSIDGCVHQNHLIKARAYSNMQPKFILYFLMSELGRSFIVEQASSTSGLHTLSLSKVSSLLVPVCSSFEQNEVIAELDAYTSQVDQLDQTITTALQQAEALRQSILKKAFAGQLVPQDPTDEPASALLARIRAAKS